MSSKEDDLPKESKEKAEDHIKSVSLMSSADAVMSHWQVSQAFMRMAKRVKRNEIRTAFLRAEQQIIEDLYASLAQTQLNEKRKDGLSSSPILRERPTDLARLGEYFPLILLSLYTFDRSWDARVFCDKCKQFVPLTELRIFELCSKHHECAALHCIPESDSSPLGLDPQTLADRYRKVAIMKSDDDRSGDNKNEVFYERTLYDDLNHNMSTILQLVQARSLVFRTNEGTSAAVSPGDGQ